MFALPIAAAPQQTHADVLLYVLYVRAIRLRVVSCTFFLYSHTVLWIFFSLPLNIVLFLFLCFQRAITFRLIRLLCLVQFTFIIEFSAHMRGGSDGACIDFLSTK